MEEPKFKVGDKVFLFFTAESDRILFAETTVLALVYSVSKAGLVFNGYRVESLIAKEQTVKPEWTFATREEAAEAFTKELTNDKEN